MHNDVTAGKPANRQEQMWAAMTARDASYDGQFVYGVMTTGVYCRPSCPSRQALRKNVAFFDATSEARAAGLRACKRCKPDGFASEDQNVTPVHKTCRLGEQTTPGNLPNTVSSMIDALDTEHIHHELNENGWCILPGLLTHAHCDDLINLYDEGNFRSTIKMARHGFGSGEYRYFAYPLPWIVETLRHRLYTLLAPIADMWAQRLGGSTAFPKSHADYLAECAAHGQTRPTPLILKYERGDYNCLHQDLYGEKVFPLQAALLLSKPGRDFTGGEFVITEQRPRMQSRPHVVPMRQGDVVIFPVRHRPKSGVRRDYRTTMRHGVSQISSGRRYAAGVIFHDAS